MPAGLSLIPSGSPTVEYAKIALRRVMYRGNLELVRSPYARRLVATLDCLAVGTVLDIGANIGQYASALRASGYRGRVISCEPLEDAYRRLARRAHGDPGWQAVRTAVGAAPGVAQINVAANSYSSSLLVATSAQLGADPAAAAVSTQPTPVTTVAALAAEHRIDPARTLVKVDTQGFESAVLDGAGALLDDVAAVQLELSLVPMYAGQVLMPELVERMSAAGLTMFGIEAGVHDGPTGRLLQCDGLFVRESLLGRPGAGAPEPA